MAAPVRRKTRLKVGDVVQVIAGDHWVKTGETAVRPSGKILKIDHERGRVVVEGVNKVKRHQRATAAGRDGGIVEREAPVHISNVMYLDGDQRTRIRKEVTPEGKRVRVAVRDGNKID